MGLWEQPYAYKGQDGTWNILASPLNWLHMHQSNPDPSHPYYVVPIIEDVRAAGKCMSIQLGAEASYKTSNNAFLRNIWEQYIAGIANDPVVGPAITAAINDGVIESIYLADEPANLNHWSNGNSALSNENLDQMSEFVKSFWPNVLTTVRQPLRTLHSSGRGVHNWRSVDRTYLTYSYDRWAGNDRPVEWLFQRELLEYKTNPGQHVKPRVMLQMGLGPRFTPNRDEHPYTGVNATAAQTMPNGDPWDWYYETGAGESQIFQNIDNNQYLYFADSPNHVDYGAKSACMPRNSLCELDPNGTVEIDCIGAIRDDREGGSNPDSVNGTRVLPFTNNNPSVVRDAFIQTALDVYSGNLNTRAGIPII